MRYHLFQKFFGKMVKIKETSFLSTRGMTLMFGNCMPFRAYFPSFLGLALITPLLSIAQYSPNLAFDTSLQIFLNSIWMGIY